MKAIVPTVPYRVSSGQSDQLLCCLGADEGSIIWAFMSPEVDIPEGSFCAATLFTNDPTVSRANVYCQNSLIRKSENLFLAVDQAMGGDVFYWNTDQTFAVAISAISRDGLFVLTYQGAGGTRYLCTAPTHQDQDGFLQGSPNAFDAANFDLQPFTLNNDFVTRALFAAWPALVTQPEAILPISGGTFTPVSASLATSIYQACRMSQYKYGRAGFDCEDYSLVYKAAASAQANLANAPAIYAVGLVFGVPTSSPAADNHAVCAFITFDAEVYVIEPQNGEIIHVSDWPYSAKTIII